MNREQKIAIIIGFAVILVVGVLLSDHWSKARQLEIADASEGDAVQYTQQPVAVLAEPAIVLPAQTNRQATSPAESGPSPEASPIVPIVISQGSTSTGSPVLPMQPPAATSLANALESTAARQQGSPVAQPSVGMSADANSNKSNMVNDMVSRLRKSYAGSVPEAARVVGRKPNLDTLKQMPQQVLQKPSALPKATTSSRHGQAGNRAQSTPTQLVRHKVAPGETLSKIARKYLGSAGKWRVIAKANPRIVTADGRVREGAILLIPAQNIPREVAVAGQRTARAISKPSHKRTAKAHRAATPAKAKTYIVKKNDTLGQIAQKLLGSTRRLKDILKANRTIITDPDDIRVGMVLKIPSA